jgi:hypothetical protein
MPVPFANAAAVARPESAGRTGREDCPPCAANTGINDHQKDSSARKVAIRIKQHKGRFPHRLRLHGMHDVDEFFSRADAPHHTLHDTDIGVVVTEIGQQCDGSCQCVAPFFSELL